MFNRKKGEERRMSKNEAIENVLSILAKYNRKMYEYGKKYRHYGTNHNLCQEQIYLIQQVGHNPNCSIRFLAAATSSNIPTVSLRVNRLVELGLLTKRRSEVTLREVEINLTEDGNKAYQFHEALDVNYFSDASKGLDRYTEEQLNTIYDFLYSLLQNDLKS